MGTLPLREGWAGPEIRRDREPGEPGTLREPSTVARWEHGGSGVSVEVESVAEHLGLEKLIHTLPAAAW